MLRIGAGGPLPAPHQTLTLDVDQAPLQYRLWPLRAQMRQQFRLSVSGDTERRQSMRRQRGTKVGHRAVRFMQAVLSGDHRVGRRIHDHRDRTTPSVDVGAVDHRMATGRQIANRGNRALEPVVDNALQGSGRQTTLEMQLPQRVTFT